MGFKFEEKNVSLKCTECGQDYEDSGWGYTQTLSSVVTITVDGKEVESCGTTMLFAENGLSPDVDFTQPDKINSKTDGKLSDNTIIAKTVNKYKNYFGKSRIVVIQSQLGDPICAYSGDEVYWYYIVSPV